MSNDRELLELSAKAAGIFLLWGGPDHDIPIDAKNLSSWDPRESDAVSLQLSVKLNLSVTQMPSSVAVCHGNEYWPELHHEYASEYIALDRLAATRRAILRAAAEIGRQMLKGGSA